MAHLDKFLTIKQPSSYVCSCCDLDFEPNIHINICPKKYLGSKQTFYTICISGMNKNLFPLNKNLCLPTPTSQKWKERFGLIWEL